MMPSFSMALWRRATAERASLWPLVPLRILVGYGMAAHGYAKLVRGPDAFAETLVGMGLPAPHPMAWFTTLFELAGGIALAAGAYVAPLAVPFTAIMATALFGVHLRYGFSSIKLKAFTAAGPEFGPPGIEVNLLYIAALLALACSAPTPWSLDRWRAARKAATAGAIDAPGRGPA